MSMRGGYQIINLDNVPFNSEDMNPFTYRQMYYNLLNSNSKLIILSGLNMDGVKYADNDVVFYEVEGESDYPIFQAVLRLTWNQAEHTCTTRYVNIQSATEEPYSWKDAKVWLSADTIIYEDVDQALDINSEKAIANKVVTENINRLDAEDETFLKLDGSREMTGSLVLPQVASGQRSITQSGSVFRVNNKSGGPVIFDGVATPASNEHGANKKYVDDSLKTINDLFWTDDCDTPGAGGVAGTGEVHRCNNILMISLRNANDLAANGQIVITLRNKTLPTANNCSVSIMAAAIPPGGDNNSWYSCYMSGAVNGNTITLTEQGNGSLTSIGSGFIINAIVALNI